ncbi:unnamed protein product [Acanthoscelides obtectus]|uniref:Uncharacterized protein n=1 Tax=Acanthoscelides obtectus TaxID=200917 RepID=A0A9P0NY79_ACAOB|nr:unnamed protein product [Acanthoscelides obtectus]CAK1679325.1 hypothetical protein AOBTE_LOCUS32211 [Acanthoscelides obtectus]
MSLYLVGKFTSVKAMTAKILEETYTGQNVRFDVTSQRNDDGLRACSNISLLIAKSGKPHTIGEKLILPAVEEVLKTVFTNLHLISVKEFP